MTAKAGGNSIATLAGRPLQPNSGIPLDLNWVQEVRVNTSAVERRAQTQVARRTVKKEWQAAWLLRAISCMDPVSYTHLDVYKRQVIEYREKRADENNGRQYLKSERCV